jgi:DUF1009 family protein
MTSPISSYLPADYDGRPIGLIAGKGRYPMIMAERIRAAGIPLRLVAFEGETESPLVDSVDPEDRATIKVGQLGRLLKTLPRLGCGFAVMAGQITPRRLFRGLHPDVKALALLNSLSETNAETVFGAIADEIEALGIAMLDARCLLDDALATPGLMTPGKLKADPEFLEHGIRIARGVADLDIGQGAVVRKGTVLAVEAYEGTDPMLKRAGGFKTDKLIFAKTVKQRQDYRFDVPVFGHRTLDVMHEAGIRTAALQAGGVLMLDKPELIERAAQLKIELYGFETEEIGPELSGH